MVFSKNNILSLLCAKQQGFSVNVLIKEIAFSKAEELLINKSIESEECQLKKITTLPDNLRSTFSIEFSSDGKYVATSHSSRIVYVLNSFTLAEKWKIITDRTVWAMNFHPHLNNILAVGTVKSKVYIYKDGIVHRKYVNLANNDDDNLTPIASMQFHPESLLLLFANRNQLYWYDWQNDSILKVISALPDTVVRFIKFIPGNSNYLLTSTTKPMVKEKLHERAEKASNAGNITELLEIFMLIANFILEAIEQRKSGNSRSWIYSMGIHYYISLYHQVMELMENVKDTSEGESSGGIDLAFTFNCMRQRINVIKTYTTRWTIESKERCKNFFTHLNVDLNTLTIAADVINQMDVIVEDFEHRNLLLVSKDELYLEYEQALWKDGANMPRWPKIYYVQYWNVEKEINLKQFYSNLVTISADTTIAVTKDFIVDFNPLLQTIEVISIRQDFPFGQRIHVLKNFPNFYYFFSVSPTQKILLIGFKKGLPGYNFETYGIFYELDKSKEKDDTKKYRTLKTNKNYDLNCLEFAPHPCAGIYFGYNGPQLYRLVQ